ncbi:hypothetical protein MN116_001185 [Schistosoma mekongi]|uniref:Palmitoyltransferase n=1 Tax=Schistosoma mekongi TaxID=38744 RepID=A0AAE2D948_SCHME|nr:hypothetical protein MN116_001185 [Schistosoma mekongi]
MNDSICSVSSDKLKRLFHWGPITTLWIISFITVTSLYSALHVASPFSSFFGLLLTACILTCFYITLKSYFCAVFLGPGFVPLYWRPHDHAAEQKLQFCNVCKGFKPPRAHHCRICNRCIMKMDHHCPWINTCCGHLNHKYFLLFLLFAPFGCITSCIALSLSIYKSPAVFPSLLLRRFPSSILFVIADLMITLFALGLAVGVTLSVGILAIFQLKAAARNQTGIESWIVSKANIWRRDIGEEKSFRYPYDLGKLANLQQVFASSGKAVGDGYYWPVVKGCTQYDLTLEQIYQKKLKQQIQRTFKITQNYDGSWCMCFRFGCLTVMRSPCFDEPRIPVHIGDSLLVTRGTKYWIYGHLIHSESSVGDFSDESIKIRGWVPRICAFEMGSKHKSDKLEFSLKDD